MSVLDLLTMASARFELHLQYDGESVDARLMLLPKACNERCLPLFVAAMVRLRAVLQPVWKANP